MLIEPWKSYKLVQKIVTVVHWFACRNWRRSYRCLAVFVLKPTNASAVCCRCCLMFKYSLRLTVNKSQPYRCWTAHMNTVIRSAFILSRVCISTNTRQNMCLEWVFEFSEASTPKLVQIPCCCCSFSCVATSQNFVLLHWYSIRNVSHNQWHTYTRAHNVNDSIVTHFSPKSSIIVSVLMLKRSWRTVFIRDINAKWRQTSSIWPLVFISSNSNCRIMKKSSYTNSFQCRASFMSNSQNSKRKNETDLT